VALMFLFDTSVLTRPGAPSIVELGSID